MSRLFTNINKWIDVINRICKKRFIVLVKTKKRRKQTAERQRQRE